MPDDPDTVSTRDFKLVSRRDGDSLDVVLAGELDMAAAFKLEPAVDRLLAEGAVRRLALDLGEVSFVDSAALGALLAIRERTRDLGIGMELVDPSAPVRRILDLSGTGSVFADPEG